VGWDDWLMMMMMAAMAMADWITLLVPHNYSHSFSQLLSLKLSLLTKTLTHFSPKLFSVSLTLKWWRRWHWYYHMFLKRVVQNGHMFFCFLFFLSFPFLLMWQLTCSHWSLYTILNWYEQIREVCFKYSLLSKIIRV